MSFVAWTTDKTIYRIDVHKSEESSQKGFRLFSLILKFPFLYIDLSFMWPDIKDF